MCGLWVYELNLSAGFDWNFRGMNEQHFFVRSNKANSDESNAGPTIKEGTRLFMLRPVQPRASSKEAQVASTVVRSPESRDIR